MFRIVTQRHDTAVYLGIHLPFTLCHIAQRLSTHHARDDYHGALLRDPKSFRGRINGTRDQILAHHGDARHGNLPAIRLKQVLIPLFLIFEAAPLSFHSRVYRQNYGAKNGWAASNCKCNVKILRM